MSPSATLHRRERGYSFEKTIVDFFNKHPGWQARRLGGSSTGLPDIVITNNNNKSILYTVEAKSRKNDNKAIIENDQIVRCFDVLHLFGIYKTREVVFAFKFMANKEGERHTINKKTGKKTKKLIHKRKLQYWFFVCQDNAFMQEIEKLQCTYDGKLSYTKKVDWDFHIYFNKYASLERMLANQTTVYHWTL